MLEWVIGSRPRVGGLRYDAQLTRGSCRGGYFAARAIM